MTAQIIDGKALSKRLRVGFRERVDRLKERGVSPGLAVILVGENPASRVYVGNKIKALAARRFDGRCGRGRGAGDNPAPQRR
jgi:5,10-methylene-tetrahydrofolate dehydrogenase/methenyl tetrahydrofolate cyclohydrolase